MAVRHFQFQDEFSNVAGRRFVVLATCGDNRRKANVFPDASEFLNRPFYCHNLCKMLSQGFD